MASVVRKGTDGHEHLNNFSSRFNDCTDSVSLSTMNSGNKLVYFTKPKFPDFAEKATRIRSFWKCTMLQSKEEMSRAGFYYTGIGDSVRCFLCGIGLRNWDQDDDPWIEHARWSPKCDHILNAKGQTFVSMVQQAIEEHDHKLQTKQQQTTCTGGKDVSKQQSQVNMSVQPNLPAASRGTPDLDTDGDSPQMLGHSPSREMYPESTLRKNPLLTDAAQVILEFGYLPKTIKTAIDRILSIHDWSHLTSQNILNEIFEMEENGELDNDMNRHQNLTSPLCNKDMTEDIMQKLKEENEEYKERTMCKICCQEPLGVVFLPCGHLMCCTQCSPAMNKCPLCRKKIKGTARVNLG